MRDAEVHLRMALDAIQRALDGIGSDLLGYAEDQMKRAETWIGEARRLNQVDITVEHFTKGKDV